MNKKFFYVGVVLISVILAGFVGIGFVPVQAAPPSGGGWTDDGTVVRLTMSSDLVGIGTTTVGSNFKLGVQGSVLLSGDLMLANLIATGTLNVAELSTFKDGFISSASSTVIGTFQVVNDGVTGGGITMSSEDYLSMTGGATGILNLGNQAPGSRIRFDTGGSNWWTESYTLNGAYQYGTAFVSDDTNGFYFTSSDLIDSENTIYVTGNSSSTISGDGTRSIIGAGLLVNASSTFTGGFISGASSTVIGALTVQSDGLFSGNLFVANFQSTGVSTTTQLYVSGTNGVGAGGIAIGTTTFQGGIYTADDIVLDLGVSVYFDSNGDSGIQGISDSDGVGLQIRPSIGGVNITGAGRVGIGTSTPSQLLSVQGSALIFGFLQVIEDANSTIFVGDASHSGCIVMGDSDGDGVTYIIVNNGVLTASSIKPSTCQ